jgi:hypothetical protein
LTIYVIVISVDGNWLMPGLAQALVVRKLGIRLGSGVEKRTPPLQSYENAALALGGPT